MNKINTIFQKKYIMLNKIIIYFLLLSMSLFLSTDYFPIIEICLAVIALYVVIFCISQQFKPMYQLIQSQFFIWYIVLWLFMIIMTWLKNESELSVLVKTWVVFTVYIVEFGILYSDVSTKASLKISNMMEIIAVFLCIWILGFEFQMLLQGNRIGYSVMVGNPNNAGTLLSVYLFFIIYNLTQAVKTKKIKHIIALILCLGVILATGSKKAIIVAVIATMLFMFKDGRIVFKRVICFTVASIIAIVACCTVPTLYNNVGRRFLSMFGELGIIDFQTDHSSELRKTYTESAIELWKKDAILGGGYNNFRRNSEYDTYSHNNYTELLCTIGIVGTILYYSYYIILLKKNIFVKDMKSILNCLFIISVFISDVGAVTFSIYPLYYMMLLIIEDTTIQKNQKELEDGE